MRKIISRLSILAVAILIFATACEKDRFLFDDSMSIVGFSSAALTITEDGTGGSLKVYLGAPGSATTTVTLVPISTGFSPAAVEGTDYTLSTKSLEVSVGESVLTVTPIDNDVFSGDKKFMIKIASNSAGYNIAAQDSAIVTISDNEHPLKNWIGTYTVEAASYGDPGNWDETWTVTTTPFAGDVTKLNMVGVGGANQAIVAKLNVVAGTITIEPGQTITAYGYSIDVMKGDGALNIPDSDAPLTGTIAPDGTILVDNWVHIISAGAYDGYVWDEFNTTWTK